MHLNGCQALAWPLKASGRHQWLPTIFDVHTAGGVPPSTLRSGRGRGREAGSRGSLQYSMHADITVVQHTACLSRELQFCERGRHSILHGIPARAVLAPSFRRRPGHTHMPSSRCNNMMPYYRRDDAGQSPHACLACAGTRLPAQACKNSCHTRQPGWLPIKRWVER